MKFSIAAVLFAAAGVSALQKDANTTIVVEVTYATVTYCPESNITSGRTNSATKTLPISLVAPSSAPVYLNSTLSRPSSMAFHSSGGSFGTRSAVHTTMTATPAPSIIPTAAAARVAGLSAAAVALCAAALF